MAAPAKKPAYPITAKHVATVASYVRRWQATLGLHQWRITVSEIRTDKRVLAELYKVDLEQKMAVIRVGRDFISHTPTDLDLNKLGLHEVLHVFHHELIETCKVPDQNVDAIRSVEHGQINILERLLLGEQL